MRQKYNNAHDTATTRGASADRFSISYYTLKLNSSLKPNGSLKARKLCRDLFIQTLQLDIKTLGSFVLLENSF